MLAAPAIWGFPFGHIKLAEDLSATVLQQRFPPIQMGTPATQAEGVMVTIHAPKIQHGADVRFRIMLTIRLESGITFTSRRTVTHDGRFPTTAFFAVGRVAEVMTIEVEQITRFVAL